MNVDIQAIREEMDNISPKFLSYSQRCDLINTIRNQCDEIEFLCGALQRIADGRLYGDSYLTEARKIARKALEGNTVSD